MSDYKYTDDMQEISGFGGGYEATCRSMVVAAMKWFDENPEAEPEWGEYKHIYGVTADENKDAKAMQAVMLEAANGDCTGAMMQASMGHARFAQKNGWAKYCQELREAKKQKPEQTP